MRATMTGTKRRTTAWLPVAVFAAAVGCESTSEPARDAHVALDASTTTDAGEMRDATTSPGLDAGDDAVVFEIRLTRIGGAVPVAGARACEVGASPENCATSDELGDVSLVLPADTDVRIRYEADGYRSFDHVFRTSGEGLRRPRYNIYTQMEEDGFYAPVGALSASTGEVTLLFESSPGREGIAGARVAIVAPADARVYYEDASGLSTTSTETNGDGLAVAFGLTAAELVFRATSASGGACAPRYGGFAATGEPGAFRVPVVLGRETRLDMDCP